MVTRRAVLKGLAGFVAGSVGLTGYAFGIEPMRTVVTRYRLTPPGWPAGLRLKLAALADIHACEPWMSAARIRSIVDETNALRPDMVVLLGDYAAGHQWVTGRVHSDAWAPELGRLGAPLGVHAILGNHDWWDDKTAQSRGHGPIVGRLALERAGIKVYENDAVRLSKDGQAFWLAGLGDQIALVPRRGSGRSRWTGVDDLPGTMAKITDGARGVGGAASREGARGTTRQQDAAPVILLAHEPDIFPAVSDRVALTLSGHTHGGQIRLFGYSPVVPSRYGRRYAYGHVSRLLRI